MEESVKRIVELTLVAFSIGMVLVLYFQMSGSEGFAQKHMAIDLALLANLVGASEDSVHYVYDEPLAKRYLVGFDEDEVYVAKDLSRRGFPYFKNENLLYSYSTSEGEFPILHNLRGSFFVDGVVEPIIEGCPRAAAGEMRTLIVQHDGGFSQVLATIVQQSPLNRFEQTLIQEGIEGRGGGADVFIGFRTHSGTGIVLEIPRGLRSSALSCFISEAITFLPTETRVGTSGNDAGAGVVVYYPESREAGRLGLAVLEGVRAYYG